MNQPKLTETQNLSGCCVRVENRLHGLFVAKRMVSQAGTTKWVRPQPRQESRS